MISAANRGERGMLVKESDFLTELWKGIEEAMDKSYI